MTTSSRNIILAVAGFVLAAAAVVAALLLPRGETEEHDTSGKVTIAVVSYHDFIPDRAEQPDRAKGILDYIVEIVRSIYDSDAEGSKQDSPPEPPTVPKQRIGLPDVLAGRIIEKLSNSQRFTVVERQALRRTMLEQRFGEKMDKTFLDRTLDEAIDNLGDIESGVVADAAKWSNYNDLVKNFQSLGQLVGADFIVLGDLERKKRTVTKASVPYSDSNKTFQYKHVDAYLRLRIINAENGSIAGAGNVNAQISELLFEGGENGGDDHDVYDQLASLTAAKILDLTFPARIVSTEPLIISRGSNDGVNQGDQYDIYHEGKEVRNKEGVLLARLKTKIGMVEVTDLQETIATVSPVSGENFQVDNLAELAGAKDMDKSGSGDRQASVPIKTSKVKVPRIAIGLVKTISTGHSDTDAQAENAQKYIPAFTDLMISRLVQTKRFQLIDRQEVDQLLNEQFAQALAENRGLPSAMGALKGADYLIYGNLISIADKEKTLKLADPVFTRHVGQVSGNMRIVDARSGDIVESQKIEVEQNIEAGISEPETVNKLASAYAEQVVLMLMNALYPIKVAHADGNGQVYINRGDDGGLSVGEELNIYRLGQPIIDPDTGVQLGTAEELIGKLVVDEVEDARSKGSIIEGSGVGRGDLLKRAVKNRDKRTKSAEKPKQPIKQPDW